MRKFFLAFLSFFLLLFFLSSPVQAADCTLTTNPSPVTTHDTTVDLTIKSAGLVSGNKYWVKLYDNFIRSPKNRKEFEFKDGKLEDIKNVAPDALIVEGKELFPPKFQAKTYIVSVGKVGVDTFDCQTSFLVQPPVSGGVACSIRYLNQSFTPKDLIEIKLHGATPSAGEGRRIVVKIGDSSGEEYPGKTSCTQNGRQLYDQGANLGNFEEGTYYIEVQGQGWGGANCGINSPILCWGVIRISTKPDEGGRLMGGGAVPQGKPFQPDCEPVDQNDPTKGYKSCQTAIGQIPTDPSGLVSFLLRLILGLSGGIALLLIIFSGYRMATSAGNPEALQGARETLTSAIVGLVFIILSLVILQVIGVDILGIPGFGS